MDERLARAAGEAREEEHDEDPEDEQADQTLEPLHDERCLACDEGRAAVVGGLPLDSALHRRRIRDLRFVLARVLEGATDGRAIGELKPLDGRQDASADTAIDLHVRAAHLKVAADLTADRRARRTDDRVASDPTVAQDGQLVAGDEKIIGHLSIEHDHVANGAHAASNLPADHHALARGDHVARHGAVDADVVPRRDEIAVDRSVDHDIAAENIQVIVDRFGRPDRDVTRADVRGRGGAGTEREEQRNES